MHVGKYQGLASSAQTMTFPCQVVLTPHGYLTTYIIMGYGLYVSLGIQENLDQL